MFEMIRKTICDIPVTMSFSIKNIILGFIWRYILRSVNNRILFKWFNRSVSWRCHGTTTPVFDL